MKAKELMVGDWVKVKPSGIVIKVAAVHQKKVAYHAVQSRLEWVRQDLLEPITTTKEILEKSEFRCIEKNAKYEWSENNLIIWVILMCREDGKKFQVVHIESLKLGIIPTIYHKLISTVHELQHALRLCGIKKEIIL